MKFKDRIVCYVAFDMETEECHVEWDDEPTEVIVELLKRVAQELEQTSGKVCSDEEPA